MKIKFLFILMLFFNSYLVSKAQTKIESVGYGTISVKPDIGVLTVNFDVLRMNMSDAINDLNSETKKVVSQIENLKISNINQSTTNFSVSVNRLYRQNKTIDSGYYARQQVLFKFKNSKENISELLTSFFKGNNGKLNFNFSFEASDSLKRQVEIKILELATKDAKEKAAVIAKSANIALGKITSINHGAFSSYGLSLMGISEDSNQLFSRVEVAGFEAKNLVFSDKVLIIYELK